MHHSCPFSISHASIASLLIPKSGRTTTISPLSDKLRLQGIPLHPRIPHRRRLPRRGGGHRRSGAALHAGSPPGHRLHRQGAPEPWRILAALNSEKSLRNEMGGAHQTVNRHSGIMNCPPCLSLCSACTRPWSWSPSWTATRPCWPARRFIWHKIKKLPLFEGASCMYATRIPVRRRRSEVPPWGEAPGASCCRVPPPELTRAKFVL